MRGFEGSSDFQWSGVQAIAHSLARAVPNRDHTTDTGVVQIGAHVASTAQFAVRSSDRFPRSFSTRCSGRPGYPVARSIRSQASPSPVTSTSPADLPWLQSVETSTLSDPIRLTLFSQFRAYVARLWCYSASRPYLPGTSTWSGLTAVVVDLGGCLA